MKVKNSPSGAPSPERSASASANVAFGDIACFALRPPQFAGESKKTRWIIADSAASKPPAQEYRAHREPGADRGEQHQLTFLQLPRAHRVVQRQRNRRRRRVAESLDVDDHLVGR